MKLLNKKYVRKIVKLKQIAIRKVNLENSKSDNSGLFNKKYNGGSGSYHFLGTVANVVLCSYSRVDRRQCFSPGCFYFSNSNEQCTVLQDGEISALSNFSRKK